MKCYLESEFKVPDSGIVVVRESGIVRIFFNFSTDTKKDIDGNDVIVPTCTNVDVNSNAYDKILAEIITAKYSQDSITAIIANYTEASDLTSTITDDKRAEHMSEYIAFQNYRVAAKNIAAKVIHLINE